MNNILLIVTKFRLISSESCNIWTYPHFKMVLFLGKTAKVRKMSCQDTARFLIFSIIIMTLFPSDGCIHIISTLSLLKISNSHVISPNMLSIVAKVFSRKMACHFDCARGWKLGSISKNMRCLTEINDLDLDMTLIFQSKKVCYDWCA